MPFAKRKRIRLPLASSGAHRYLKIVRTPPKKQGLTKTVRDRLRKKQPTFMDADACAIGVLCISLFRKLYRQEPGKRLEQGQEVFAYPGKFIRAMDGLIFNYFRRKKSNGAKLTEKYLR